MTKINNFTDLLVWQKAHSLVLLVYKVTRCFPDDEKFALSNQLRRAAVSITSNIAEGFGRNSAKDKVQFYSMAKGSLLEVHSQLYIAKDLGYIKPEEFAIFDNKTVEIAKMISGLRKSAV